MVAPDHEVTKLNATYYILLTIPLESDYEKPFVSWIFIIIYQDTSSPSLHI